jgi:hypothetical protein
VERIIVEENSKEPERYFGKKRMPGDIAAKLFILPVAVP